MPLFDDDDAGKAQLPGAVGQGVLPLLAFAMMANLLLALPQGNARAPSDTQSTAQADADTSAPPPTSAVTATWAKPEGQP